MRKWEHKSHESVCYQIHHCCAAANTQDIFKCMIYMFIDDDTHIIRQIEKNDSDRDGEMGVVDPLCAPHTLTQTYTKYLVWNMCRGCLVRLWFKIIHHRNCGSLCLCERVSARVYVAVDIRIKWILMAFVHSFVEFLISLICTAELSITLHQWKSVEMREMDGNGWKSIIFSFEQRTFFSKHD